MSVVQASTSCVSFVLFEGHLLTFEASAQLVNAFINSRLDYCNSLLAGVSDQLIGQLQSVLRAAARLVLQITITSLTTFKTNYTGFLFDKRNFVQTLFARFPLLHTSRRCFLSLPTVMHCGLIARRLVAISSFHGHSP